MPERAHRRKSGMAGGSGRRIKPPHPSFRRKLPSGPLTHRGRPTGNNFRRHSSSSPSGILKRCSSEPSLKVVVGGGGASSLSGSEGGWDDGSQTTASLFSESEGSSSLDGGVLYRPMTCTDVFCSSGSLMGFPSPSHVSDQGHNRDAKVVLNITVEGSPGPVRTMVKLGSSVEDAIKLVVEKYGEERRTPKLEKDAATSYELHHSYFSLQCLDKLTLIGDARSRNFYLRRSSSSNHSINGASSSFTSDIAPSARASMRPALPTPPFLLPTFIARKLGKIVRRTQKLWKLIICWK